MNSKPISPDDERLTAYALNEMEPAQRAEFERLLQADPEAQRQVEEIRAAGSMLAMALEHEPAPGLGAAEKPAAIIPGGDFRRLDGGGSLKEELNRPVRFPQFYYVVSGLAAACFAVFFVYWQQNQPQPGLMPRKLYTEVILPKEPVEQAAVAVALPAPAAMPVTLGRAEVDYSRAVASAPPPPPPVEEETVVLAPFEIQKAKAANTLAAARVRSVLKDSGSTVTEVSGRFLADLGASDSGQQLRYAGGGAPGAVTGRPAAQAPSFNTESYDFRQDSAFLRVTDNPLSTFAVDVDTASYANVRRFLAGGQRPPADAVRIEELVNYFPYHYAPPTGPAPFAASLEVASAPWTPEHRLVRIGLKGREVSDAARPAANLVFLLDVSGSMDEPNKLPLVKQSLRLLVNKLRADDRVAIAVYAGASGLALPSTPAGRKAEILEAIERLDAGGPTNGALGIQLAYDIAKANFIPGGVNRVILATDGDFNVGTTSPGELTRLIEEKAKSGVFLSVLGFGLGNLKDGTLERLADKGNGNYAYIDTLAEAKKALVEQAGGTLVTIAKDVKIQVEFNPAQVQAYRLIGYENRLLAKEDFNNDQVDAGEIGAGHTVTALYELVPVGAALPATGTVEALKYQPVTAPGATATPPTQPRGGLAAASELLTVKIRYKEPAGEVSSKLEFPLRDTGTRFEEASEDFRFAAAVAAFGLVLRDSPTRGHLTLAEVSRWAASGTGADAGGYRNEFLGLIRQAQPLIQ